MSQQPILYKVWAPGQSPASHDPVLTLHTAQIIQFFVEAIARGRHPFAGQPFAIVAYQVRGELFERPLAEGTYQLHLEDGHIQFHALYEAGPLEPGTELNIISAALQGACTLIEQEQVL